MNFSADGDKLAIDALGPFVELETIAGAVNLAAIHPLWSYYENLQSGESGYDILWPLATSYANTEEIYDRVFTIIRSQELTELRRAKAFFYSTNLFSG